MEYQSLLENRIINRDNPYPLFLFHQLKTTEMIDVNTELFKRTAPVRKIGIIENLKQDELLGISKETIIRIVKEIGRRKTDSRNYEFYVTPERRRGNDWNSFIEGLWLYKGKLSLITYIQLDDTDTTVIVPLNDFSRKRLSEDR